MCLAASGVYFQRQSVSATQKRCDVLRQRLEKFEKSSASMMPAALSERLVDPTQPIDLRQISFRFRDLGWGDPRLNHKLRQRLESMGTEELAALVEQTPILGLAPSEQSRLLGILLDILAEKDPAFTMTRFGSDLADGDQSVENPLNKAFTRWLDSHPADAIAWFDMESAAGHLDGKGIGAGKNEKKTIEGIIVKSLIQTDLATAFARLEKMPLNEQLFFLRDTVRAGIPSGNEIAFAEMVRKRFPKIGGALVISAAAVGVMEAKGLEGVSECLRLIDASSDERGWTAVTLSEKQVDEMVKLKSLTWEKFEALSQWIAETRPENAGSITGRALARILNKTDAISFAQTAAWAAELDRAGNSDATLRELVKCSVGNLEERPSGQAMIDTITDPILRQKAQELFHQTADSP